MNFPKLLCIKVYFENKKQQCTLQKVMFTSTSVFLINKTKQGILLVCQLESRKDSTKFSLMNPETYRMLQQLPERNQCH